MDKGELLAKVIVDLLKTADTFTNSSRSARQASIEAPSKMESRYDSTKSEQDWLSHELAVASNEIRQKIAAIREVDLSPSQTVREGSLVFVGTERDDGDKATKEGYFVLPSGSGVVIHEENFPEVTVITPKSPMGKAIMGMSVGFCGEVKTPGGIQRVVIESVE
ncbi:MAG: GreA/GreB family elongation factor [Patescibacteria group bacterium]|nr:GreA/GreB family elongation factor [Patescibacteria group bacterium]